MATSEHILQSDILGMFEASQSQSIKSHYGFLKAGVEALNAAPIDGNKFSDLAKISGNSLENFYTRFREKHVLLCALRSDAVDAINPKICADFTPEKLWALPRQEVPDGLDNIYNLIKSDDLTVLSSLKEALRAYTALSPLKRKY